jgi:hypothetical protein
MKFAFSQELNMNVRAATLTYQNNFIISHLINTVGGMPDDKKAKGYSKLGWSM